MHVSVSMTLTCMNAVMHMSTAWVLMCRSQAAATLPRGSSTADWIRSAIRSAV
jgi:hypothetical protein